MEYRHIHFFLAVADELHFTRAAARLGVAQPHVSQEIGRLEREIGVRLFARTRRKVELTPAGDAFRTQAREILLASASAVEAARRAARGETGRLTVGFAGSAGYDVLPASVREFRSRWPEVELRLLDMTTVAQIASLGKGTIDVAFGRPRSETQPGLVTEIVRDEQPVLAVPTGHARIGRGAPTLGDLSAESWVVFDRTSGPGLFTWFVTACEDAGFSPRIVQEAGEIPTIINLVASGLGVALVPAPVSSLTRTGVTYLPLASGTPPIHLGVMWRRGETGPVVHHFLETVRAVAARKDGPA